MTQETENPWLVTPDQSAGSAGAKNMKLFLKGERCYTDKCCASSAARIRRASTARAARKFSEYGVQLREKQKVKRIYGLLERQFRGYYDKADRA